MSTYIPNKSFKIDSNKILLAKQHTQFTIDDLIDGPIKCNKRVIIFVLPVEGKP